MPTTRPMPGVNPPQAAAASRRTTWLAAAIITSLCALSAPVAQARADAAPSFTSGEQINVLATTKITDRTYEVEISTPLIAGDATNKGNRLRVTVPDDYAVSPGSRYPVIYLLHGGGGGAYSDWTDSGRVEEITAGHGIIAVMPEGGKVGWYTNWQNQWRGTQRWAEFHHTAVIPFIDRNLRTIATKDGRAVAGLSMGGYGAMRLAQDRPDLYASVSSFSGALDLRYPGTQLVICQQSLANGYGCLDSFGLRWRQFDPVQRARRLKDQDVQILLYAGSGSSDVDVIERAMGWSTHTFAKALSRAGVPHFWWMYGRPGQRGDFTCDGGHNFGCWSYALDDALPRILGRLAPPVTGAPYDPDGVQLVR